MIYQNRLITITYLEEVDILIVSWHTQEPYDAAELHQTIEKVIELINNYHCKKLLIDASEANFSIEDDAVNAALTDFAYKLRETSIRKLARIITADQSRERGVQAIRDKISLPFHIYDISNREQALNWLKEN